eukprot:4946446-Heterocapsa_arctica.AAC.1
MSSLGHARHAESSCRRWTSRPSRDRTVAETSPKLLVEVVQPKKRFNISALAKRMPRNEGTVVLPQRVEEVVI